MQEKIKYKIWNDYCRGGLLRSVRAKFSKEKYKIIGVYKGKKFTTYYIELK